MNALLEKRLLQAAVVVLSLVPISAGLAGALLGTAMTDAPVFDLDTDSHMRYLSGLLLGIGLLFWGAVPAIEHRTGRFRLLTAIVFVGGLGRLYGVLRHGWPGAPMLFGLCMELGVTPLLCLWQSRVARRL
jgi:hypothetical protein